MKFVLFFLHLLTIVVLIMAVFVIPSYAFANEAGYSWREADTSASPSSRVLLKDLRADKLKAYLASYNSPLTPYARVFVAKADQYDLDWRLVASISGVESTFGKVVPSNSYNAYGWNGGNFAFKSWEDGIDTVSKTLRERYIDTWDADTVWEIAPYYAPPSKTWAYKVNYFMEQIEKGPKTKDLTLELKLTI